MTRPGFLARWRTFLRVIRGKEPERVILRQPDQDRVRQRVAARQAFLSDQPPGRRVLCGPDLGDIR